MNEIQVGAREGFDYHSAKLLLMDNGNRHWVNSNTFFSGKAVYP